MDQIKCWMLILCFAVLICSIFEMLCPNGRMEKTMNFILGMFFICSIFVPIFSITQKFDISLKDKLENYKPNSKLKQKTTEQIKNLASSKIKNLVNGILTQEEVSIKKIEVIINNEENIEEVKIFIDFDLESTKKENIKRRIKNELGLNANIITKCDKT
jgi:hypothetical protein